MIVSVSGTGGLMDENSENEELELARVMYQRCAEYNERVRPELQRLQRDVNANQNLMEALFQRWGSRVRSSSDRVASGGDDIDDLFHEQVTPENDDEAYALFGEDEGPRARARRPLHVAVNEVLCGNPTWMLTSDIWDRLAERNEQPAGKHAKASVRAAIRRLEDEGLVERRQIDGRTFEYRPTSRKEAE
jgi:hypothetical protein